ncbi:hypothetical protein TNCV_1952151 [Trichonephila clavipes]|nr:hypothetical protein TNCV_1952151 [Trichonephila clavipes]
MQTFGVSAFSDTPNESFARRKLLWLNFNYELDFLFNWCTKEAITISSDLFLGDLGVGSVILVHTMDSVWPRGCGSPVVKVSDHGRHVEAVRAQSQIFTNVWRSIARFGFCAIKSHIHSHRTFLQLLLNVSLLDSAKTSCVLEEFLFRFSFPSPYEKKETFLESTYYSNKCVTPCCLPFCTLRFAASSQRRRRKNKSIIEVSCCSKYRRRV